jgi:FeS assembly SUF system protein
MKQLPVLNLSQPTVSAQPNEELHTAGMTSDPDRTAALRPQIVEALSKVFDPEIPVNIYELGLIYDIIVDQAGVVGIRMTLTAPACPAAQFLPLEVKQRIAEIHDVTDVRVDIVWDPPWDRDRMSDAAKLQLGMF